MVILATMESKESLRRRKAAPPPIKTKRSGNEGGADGLNNTGILEEEEPLSPAARLFHEPNFNVHVIAIMGCKTKICPHVVKANLPNTLLKHPRFSSLMVKIKVSHNSFTFKSSSYFYDGEIWSC